MIELLDSGAKCKFITVIAETNNAACRNITEITLVAKLFASKGIAQVNFNKRNIDGEEGIPRRDTGVGECTRIDKDEVDTVSAGLLYTVDHFMFRITLETLQFMSEFGGDCGQRGFDVGKAGLAVDAGFARAQQIQVGTVDEEQPGHAFVSCSFAEDGGNTTSFHDIYAKFNVKR